jgi:hypothetical protein
LVSISSEGNQYELGNKNKIKILNKIERKLNEQRNKSNETMDTANNIETVTRILKRRKNKNQTEMKEKSKLFMIPKLYIIWRNNKSDK